MPSPFPGMDPFLEHPSVFPDLHDSMIAALRETLNSELRPPYYAGIGTRVWLEPAERRIGPDVKILKGNGHAGGSSGPGGTAVLTATAVRPVVVHVEMEEVREPFLEIYASPGGERLVTTIEVLSLSNKASGAHGREEYLRKQREILGNQVNLVEIDLLRAGSPTTAVPHARAVAAAGEFDYHVCVRRFDRAGEFVVYPIQLPQALPTVDVPLLAGDPDVRVDLQAVLARCYQGGNYERRVRYDRRRLAPPLRKSQEDWVDGLLSRPGTT